MNKLKLQPLEDEQALSLGVRETAAGSLNRTHSSARSCSSSADSSFDYDSICDGTGTGENTSIMDHSGRGVSTCCSEEEDVAAQETRKIFALRLLIFCTLAISVAGALCVYFYLSNAETTKFEDQFHEDATKVLASLGATLDVILGAMDEFVVGMVSHAKATNQTWPFVVIPDFGIRAKKTRALSASFVMNIYPYVESDEREQWEHFSLQNSERLVVQGLDIQRNDNTYKGPIAEEYEIWNVIHTYDEFELENPGLVGTNSTGPYLPFWLCDPMIPFVPFNWDLMSLATDPVYAAIDTHQVSLGFTYMIALPNDTFTIKANEAEAHWIETYLLAPGEEAMEPISDIYYPIIADAADAVGLFQNGDYNPREHNFLGFLAVSAYWRDRIRDILSKGSTGVVVVFENPCNPAFTYQIDGPTVQFLGTGDFHDPKYSHMGMSSLLVDLRQFAIKNSSYTGIPINEDVCPYTIRVFPSDTMKSNFLSNTPIYLSLCSGLILLFFAFVFIIYDKWVQRRQHIVSTDAAKSAAIVSSMFPKEIQKRMMEEHEAENGHAFMSQDNRLKTFLIDGSDVAEHIRTARPIAELYPFATVGVGDIAGFSAWTSTRDPSQAFLLLETIFKAFDEVARRRKVFKVETVGDSYVAVTGLPVAQANHAILMARFAADCQQRFSTLVKSLEVSLGPDTADLKLRFGLHSGPVTAGVLRGDRSRFQLFGNTVNTASRIEKTCRPNKIHCSNATAALLREAGKGHWLQQREDKVAVLKAQGVLETFYIIYRPPTSASAASEQSFGRGTDLSTLLVPTTGQRTDNKKRQRMVKWVSELLLAHTKKVIAWHEACGITTPDDPSELVYTMPEGKTSMDEVVEVFDIANFDEAVAAQEKNYTQVNMSPVVVQQLQSLVGTIADTYLDNFFHNWEHCCHVTMSVDKFLTRIVTPDIHDTTGNSKAKMASHLHHYTFGITSDPLAVLAIVFSAVIHDVDHRGVSNVQLAKEDVRLGKLYDKSIAEQNSMDMTWEIFMRPEFAELRTALFCTRSEMMRFRQVVVNIVLATDIFDKELNDLRKNRWNRAFGTNSNFIDEHFEARKAAVVIEHIMQASDVSHTMQHWHVYRKWNERLFFEIRAAFKAGRCAMDPAEFWYMGELGFFDNYIIPLAQKLRDCKVFGVSSDEVLNYAQENRAEWMARGEEIVTSMVAKAEEVEQGSHVLEDVKEEVFFSIVEC